LAGAVIARGQEVVAVHGALNAAERDDWAWASEAAARDVAEGRPIRQWSRAGPEPGRPSPLTWATLRPIWGPNVARGLGEGVFDDVAGDFHRATVRNQ
jgi:hypothetical protein